MSKKEPELEQIILTHMMRLNGTIYGIVTGLVGGLTILIATNWLVIKGGPVVGPHLALLSQYLVGYKVSFVGSLIGCAYGFAIGFAAGYFVAQSYNWIVSLREKSARRRP